MVLVAGEVKSDTISERTAAVGVTIDGLLIKDGEPVVADNKDIKFASGAKIERDDGHLKLTPENGKGIKVIDKRLVNYVPLTEVQVLDLSGQGNVNWTDLDLTAHTSAHAIAVMLTLWFTDSGSATADVYGQTRGKGGTNAQVIDRGCYINSLWNLLSGICAVDADQILQYEIKASGGNTASFRIWLFGYFEKIEA